MTGRRLRILHLAFEDHRRPGSGGGGIRSREINRRLAVNHDITVVTTRYPGARRRHEDGVEYRPLGFGRNYFLSVATYHLALPFFLPFCRHDLVVEDFSAPVSSSLVPLWTRRPKIAVVQWLAARHTSRRYWFPFFVFEEIGIRLHRRFIAASEAVAAQLRAANPGADIRVVYSGLDLPPLDPSAPPPAPSGPPGPGAPVGPVELLYMGRLELRPKGLDLLVDIVERLGGTHDVRVTVAGDGPHRARLERMIASHGLGGRFRLVGRVDAPEKWQLLRRASVVVLPSRYESFGMVAAEAMAAGTPLVAWDLPSFREIVVPEAGRLVRPFDTGSFASAIRELLAELSEPGRRAAAAEVATASARHFDWDAAARAQEDAYLAAVGDPRRRRVRAGAARSR